MNSSRKVLANQLSKPGSILFLSPTLWPLPDASAAGVRTAELLIYFASSKQYCFKHVHYGCGQTTLPPTVFPGVQMHHIPANRTETINNFLHGEVFENLKVVVFDRFFSEEAYSFHFHNERPDVLRILDMQDMHSLRKHRQTMINATDLINADKGLHCFEDGKLMDSFPQTCHSVNTTSSSNAMLLRELSAIHRSDLTLVCSQFELELLRDEYRIPAEKLILASFFTEEVPEYFSKKNDNSSFDYSFENRKDFVALGGFKHPPNVDQVLLLKNLWPRIREVIPEAKLHIYGSFPSTRIQQLHSPKQGFVVHGYVKDLNMPLGNARVMLSPLRFGAGIKGKIIDSWRYGCPVLTTPIGAEGIGNYNDEWGGIVVSDEGSFVESAVELYTKKATWEQSQRTGRNLLKNLFGTNNLDILKNAVVNAHNDIDSRRQKDYMSAMLWHNSSRSTENFSRWIELKESFKENGNPST